MDYKSQAPIATSEWIIIGKYHHDKLDPRSLAGPTYEAQSLVSRMGDYFDRS